MLAEILHKIATFDAEEDHPYYPRPSIAGPERCIRQMTYWCMNIEKKSLPGRTYHIFNDGNFHEELVKDWIRKSSFDLHSEQMKVDCGTEFGINLKGSIDGVVTDILMQDYLLEVKGLNHFTFERFWKGTVPLDYLTQVCLYLRGLQKINPELSLGILLVKNKNTSAYLEFLIKYETDKDVATVISRTNSAGEVISMDEIHNDITMSAFKKFADVKQHCNDKVLPIRPYTLGEDWNCDYCSYNGICWDGYEKEFEQLKTDQMLPETITELVCQYKELGNRKKEITAQHDDIRKTITSAMKEANAQSGYAGNYILKRKLEKRKSIDKKLLSKQQIQIAEKETTFEKLYIANTKGGDDNE